jgi:hypothetical protein
VIIRILKQILEGKMDFMFKDSQNFERYRVYGTILKDLNKKQPVKNISNGSIFHKTVCLTLKDAKIHRNMNKELDQYVDESLDYAAQYEAN